MAHSNESKASRRLALAAAASAATVSWSRQAAAQVPAGSRHRATAVSLLDYIPSEQHELISRGGSSWDCAPAFEAAFAAGARIIRVPSGSYFVGSSIRLPAHAAVYGEGYGIAPGQAATILRSSGAFDVIVVSGGAQLHNLSVEGLPGNQGNGIVVVGGRSVVRDVSVFGQGQDGLKIGERSAGGANTNLWRLTNVISRGNRRHGLYVAHEGKGALPDANAGILCGFEASYNGGDGLRLGETVDNQLLGVAVQSNGGHGVRLESLARGNVLLAPYAEANKQGDILLEEGADRNLVLGVRSGVLNSGTVNRGTDNMVWGRYGSVSGVPLHEAPEAFEALDIVERTGGGVWRFHKQPGSRHLRIELTRTGKGADVLLQSAAAGSSGLRFGTDEHSAALRDLRSRGVLSLRFGVLPPQGSADLAVKLNGADAGCSFQVTPLFAPPAGVSWCAYWDPAAAVAKVRCVNSSAIPAEVAGAFQVIALRVN